MTKSLAQKSLLVELTMERIIWRREKEKVIRSLEKSYLFRQISARESPTLCGGGCGPSVVGASVVATRPGRALVSSS